MKNPAAKMRNLTKGEQPYLTVEWPDSPFGPTTFKVVKVYQMNPDKPYARAMVLAVSSMTGPSGDYGDAYWGDIRGTVTQRDPAITDEMIPSHLKGGPLTATTLNGVMDELLGKPEPEPEPVYPNHPDHCDHRSVMFVGLTTPNGTCQECGATLRHGGLGEGRWVRVEAVQA